MLKLVKEGMQVKVAGPGADSTFDLARLGQVGTIYGLDSGTRNRSGDPMVMVEFEDGMTDGFWSEELEAVRV